MWGWLVMFNPRRGRSNVGVHVRVDVDAAVVEGAAPWTMVDEDGVTAPTEASAAPTKDAEVWADDDSGAEADRSADNEARPRCEKDDCGIVNGNVVIGGVDGLNFDVAAVVYDCVIGGRG